MWIRTQPDWLQVRPAPPVEGFSIPKVLHELDPGEQEAIKLAYVAEGSLLIIDEKAGRRIAKELGLSMTGTIGVLDLAASERLIDVPDVISRIRATSFRAAPRLYRWLLDRHS